MAFAATRCGAASEAAEVIVPKRKSDPPGLMNDWSSDSVFRSTATALIVTTSMASWSVGPGKQFLGANGIDRRAVQV